MLFIFTLLVFPSSKYIVNAAKIIEGFQFEIIMNRIYYYQLIFSTSLVWLWKLFIQISALTDSVWHGEGLKAQLVFGP